MKKFYFSFFLLSLVFCRVPVSGSLPVYHPLAAPHPFTVAPPPNGVTYGYDAAGNRVSRIPNTIVITSAQPSPSGRPIEEGILAVLPDSLWGEEVTVSLREGEKQLFLEVSKKLAAQEGKVGICLIDGDYTLPLYAEALVPSQTINLESFSPGNYSLDITIGQEYSRWSVIIREE
ncbi:MAG: hypothetical protein AB2L24_23745 [Mangrovibacterium sp.]